MTQLAPLVGVAPATHRLVVGAAGRTSARWAAVPALVLLVAAIVAVHDWWGRGAVVPLSWAAPSAEALVLLPVVPVVGLLVGRALPGPRRAGTALWLTGSALAWVGVTAAWMVTTSAQLYGGFRGLASADNLVQVLGSSDVASARAALLGTGALVALFGARSGRVVSLALAALVLAGALAAFPALSLGHAHGQQDHQLLLVAAAAEVIGGLLWVGVLLVRLAADGWLTGRVGLRWLASSGGVVTGAAGVVGVGCVLAASAAPVPTSAAVAIVQLAAIATVLTVGQLHRSRLVALLDRPHPVRRWALLAGDGAVLLAVVLLGAGLPLAG